MATRASQAPPVWTFEEHEHRELERGLNRLHDLACEVGHRPTPELSLDVLDVLRWLDQVLEPHIAWEEGWLYPEIDARVGTPWATRGPRFDHNQIRQMTEHVRVDQVGLASHGLSDRTEDLRGHLYGLEALVRAHVEREEQFLIPLLDEDARPRGADRPSQ